VLYYPHGEGDLVYFDDMTQLQAYARDTGCLLVPHHLGYRGPGGAGHDWSTHDASITRVAEIYSEHGASERDRGPYPMVRHSGPGRATDNCAQAALASGLRFGFIASTDGHLGCPGAYPEGLVGVLAPELTRSAIWDGLWNRRTIAVTGDRIDARLRVNGSPMGSELPWDAERRIQVDVVGWDEIDRVELIKNNQVLERFYPSGAEQGSWPGRARCRLEVGWGRWTGSGELALTPWKVTVEVEDGTIESAMPCLRSRPYLPSDEPGIKELTPDLCYWEAHTTQRYAVEGIQCFEDSNAQGVALDIAGPSEARLVVRVVEPEEKILITTLSELTNRSLLEPLGPLAGGWVVVHRAVLPGDHTVRAQYTDSQAVAARTDYYYLRVAQANGQMAWTSPIWVGAAE
jgi:hypothetical protein